MKLWSQAIADERLHCEGLATPMSARTQHQLQALLDDGAQRRAFLSGQALAPLQQVIVDLNGGLHMGDPPHLNGLGGKGTWHATPARLGGQLCTDANRSIGNSNALLKPDTTA